MRASTRLAKALEVCAYRPPDYTVDNLVVGGGVIGLAVAAKLREKRPDQTTFLVERHGQVGSTCSVEHLSIESDSEIFRHTDWTRDEVRSCIDRRRGSLTHQQVPLLPSLTAVLEIRKSFMLEFITPWNRSRCDTVSAVEN